MSGSSPIARQELLDIAFPETAVVERCRISRVRLAPGQRHTHPCPVVGYVVFGAIRFQVADQPSALLRAGEAFYEPQGARIPHFDNASDAEPAVFLACYLLPPGEENVIEMLATGESG